jgi:hypothetical protein
MAQRPPTIVSPQIFAALISPLAVAQPLRRERDKE